MADINVKSPIAQGPLLEWLIASLKPMSRSKVKELLRHGQVQVNGTAVTQFDHPIRPLDRIAITRERGTPSKHGLKQSGIVIIYEDDHLLVIDKPPGLLTVSTDAEKTETAFVHLNAELESRRGGRALVVHRIDRETSGLLIFALTEGAHANLKANWPGVEKTYLAVVEGAPTATEGRVESYLVEGHDLRVKTCKPDRLNAKRAVSHYRLLQQRGKFSLVEVKLETGRKHQIRVHMAGLGCPVIGDKGYGSTMSPAKRLGLHAWRLMFPHPITGLPIMLESPLPAVLRQVVG